MTIGTAPQNASMSPEPLYIQIKNVLKQRILDGTYRPHQRLPSETELMNTFGVSRITVRQALRDLHGEGLVFSAQGKGSFVSKPKAVQDVYRLEGFDEAMSQKGYETASKLLAIQERRPIRAVRDALRLGSGESVVEVKRIRYLNREPISIDTSYFPLDVGRLLFGRDLGRDIFPMLENELGIQLGEAHINLEARNADKDTAELLNIELGSPVMWVMRLTYDADGRPIDYEYLAYRGDAYQYRFRIERRSNEGEI